MEVDGRKPEEEDIRETETFCEPCNRENVTVSANGLCTECEEYMCKVCFGHHLKAKSCSHHVLLEQTKDNMERTKVNVEICTKHDNEKVRFFCRKHTEVGCGDCMILKHNACKPEYIKDLSKNLHDEEIFKDMKHKMNELELGANNALKLTQDQINENDNMLDKALKEIRNFRKMFNDYLDKAEAKMVSEAKNIHLQNETRMKTVEELIESVHKNVETLQQDLSTEGKRDSVLFIHSVHCKPKLADTEQSLKKAKSENNITKFVFEADEKLMGFVSPEHQLGHFIEKGKKWNKSDLTPSMFSPGVRVQRGPDWNAGDADGNGLGTVTKVYSDYSLYVDWDHGVKHHGCRGGAKGFFHIEPAFI